VWSRTPDDAEFCELPTPTEWVFWGLPPGGRPGGVRGVPARVFAPRGVRTPGTAGAPAEGPRWPRYTVVLDYEWYGDAGRGMASSD